MGLVHLALDVSVGRVVGKNQSFIDSFHQFLARAGGVVAHLISLIFIKYFGFLSKRQP